jgi:hypothetical protein
MGNPVVGKQPIPDKPGWNKVELDVGGVKQTVELRDDVLPDAIDSGRSHFTVPIDVGKLPKKRGQKK